MNRDEALFTMCALNGEIRVQPIRYLIKDCQFMALVALEDLDPIFWDAWDDMLGGDPEYYEAEMCLSDPINHLRHRFGFAYGSTPDDAIQKAFSCIVRDEEQSQ